MTPSILARGSGVTETATAGAVFGPLGAVLGAGLGIVPSILGNRGVSQSQRAAAQAQGVEAQQVAEQQALGLFNNARTVARLRGQSLVTAISGNFGSQGTEDVVRIADIEGAINDAVIRQNAANNQLRIRSGGRAQQVQLNNSRQSGFLAGIQGGISGLSTGLAIDGALQQQDAVAQQRANLRAI